jgi:hypothetical protein
MKIWYNKCRYSILRAVKIDFILGAFLSLKVWIMIIFVCNFSRTIGKIKIENIGAHWNLWIGFHLMKNLDLVIMNHWLPKWQRACTCFVDLNTGHFPSCTEATLGLALWLFLLRVATSSLQLNPNLKSFKADWSQYTLVIEKVVRGLCSKRTVIKMLSYWHWWRNSRGHQGISPACSR